MTSSMMSMLLTNMFSNIESVNVAQQALGAGAVRQRAVSCYFISRAAQGRRWATHSLSEED